MKLKTLRDIDVKGKTIIHRCDFNIKLKNNDLNQTVPVSNVRLKAYFPSIFYLLNRGCKIVFMSYLERPGGKVVKKLSLKPVADRLSNLINREVKSLPDCIGEGVQRHIQKMKPGDMVMLENTRFHSGEEEDDDRFAQALAKNGQIMVQDAFGQCHRVHASITGIPRHIPTVAGLYLLGEVNTFNKLISNPQKPLVLIVGGTKTYDKIVAIRHLASKADYILVGGAVANNFLKAKNIAIGKSFLEEPFVDKAKKTKITPVEEAKKLLAEFPQKIIIPYDAITNTKHLISLAPKAKPIRSNQAFVDIGPKTTKHYSQIIKNAKTIFWDGPMGKYEDTRFRKGTLNLAENIADNDNTTILAGGDTAAVAENFGLIFRYSHVSIAGGAALQFLSGNPLPGLKPMLIK